MCRSKFVDPSDRATARLDPPVQCAMGLVLGIVLSPVILQMVFVGRPLGMLTSGGSRGSPDWASQIHQGFQVSLGKLELGRKGGIRPAYCNLVFSRVSNKYRTVKDLSKRCSKQAHLSLPFLCLLSPPARIVGQPIRELA